jgi:mono/diheme cytochrome c family protein
MKKGANPVTMAEMKKGGYCGKCHNGITAFSPELESCYRCHAAQKMEELEEGMDPEAEAKAGQIVYEKWCAPCHGLTGKGDGPAAPFLVPKPRNFFAGAFKIRTTESGELPQDDDVLKIIMKGMPGSSMPAWEGLITTTEAKQTVVYIKTLIEEEVMEYWPPETVTIGEPLPVTAESIAKGKELYTTMKCWECHGNEGKGDGLAASKLKDDWGFPIKAADLTQGWNFRGGHTITDIFRTFTTGLNGTPMPAYLDVLSDEDRWHLANFVKSMSADQKPMLGTFMQWEKGQE